MDVGPNPPEDDTWEDAQPSSAISPESTTTDNNDNTTTILLGVGIPALVVLIVVALLVVRVVRKRRRVAEKVAPMSAVPRPPAQAPWTGPGQGPQPGGLWLNPYNLFREEEKQQPEETAQA